MLLVVVAHWEEKHALLPQEPFSHSLPRCHFLYSRKAVCLDASFNSTQDFQNASFSQENKTDFYWLTSNKEVMYFWLFR